MLSESMVKPLTELWTNKDNELIYEQMPIEHFKTLANKIGFSNGEELEHVRDYVLDASSALDVGGGYGRILKKIKEINPKAQISAVERNQRLAAYLREQFPSATILENDFLDITLDQRFDLVTLMWSELTEYNQKEQSVLIAKMQSLLTPNGRVIIELADLTDLSHQKHPYAMCRGEQDYEYAFMFSKDSFYVPKREELKQMFADASLSIEQSIDYCTNGCLRRIIVLKSL